jgi:hypothetical protein
VRSIGAEVLEAVTQRTKGLTEVVVLEAMRSEPYGALDLEIG